MYIIEKYFDYIYIKNIKNSLICASKYKYIRFNEICQNKLILILYNIKQIKSKIYLILLNYSI